MTTRLKLVILFNITKSMYTVNKDIHVLVVKKSGQIVKKKKEVDSVSTVGKW